MTTGTATLTALTNEQGGEIAEGQRRAIPVQFNPETLDLTYTNSVQKGQRRQPPQVITETKAQLSYELVFDTTHNGIDVRKKTLDVAKFMDPKDPRQATRRNNSIGVPSKVLFEWGTFKFEGYIDNIKEKLDFFSSEGVPLRSTLNVSMTNAQKDLIPSSQGEKDAVNTQGDLDLGSGADAYQSGIGKDLSLSDKARQLGDESSARALGVANGIENLRLPEVDNLVLIDSAEFRSSASFGASVNAGISTNASAGFSAGLSLGGTNSSFGSSLSSSSSASTESLFGGLKTGTSASLSLEPKLNLAANASLSVGIDAGIGAGAGIDIGIGLGASAGASLKADVGVNADFEAGIKFEE